MEIRHLKTFLGVANVMSFNKATEHLNYAQSSVSAQIQALEEELGVHSPSSSWRYRDQDHEVFGNFLVRATERAILSSLKIVLNSIFLLIQSFLFITESVIAPL